MLTCKLGKKEIDTFSFNSEDLRNWSNKKMLKCPVCNERIIYCKGEFKNPYFKHEKNSDCPDIYSEGVTEEHISGIKTLYNWLKTQNDISNLQLEKWIEETRQRPDIYFKYKGEEYVIEYQCSPISTQYSKRHELYNMLGIKDIWILGTNKYFEYNFNYIEKNIYLNIGLERRFKTIESEILNGGDNLIYLNSSNKRFYITNKKITTNSIRIKTSYYGDKYKQKLKTTYDCFFKSIFCDDNQLNNILNKDINLKDDYIDIIRNIEINTIKDIINNDMNLNIINEQELENKYYIKYKDITNKEHSIFYNYNDNKFYGFMYNNKETCLYFNCRNTLCMDNLNNRFRHLIKDYYIIGNSIVLQEDIDKNFINMKFLSISNNNNKIKTNIINIINIYKEYLYKNYDFISNIDLDFYETNIPYVEIIINYEEYKKTFKYKIYDFNILNSCNEITSFIKNELFKEKDNIKTIYKLKEHYEYYLSEQFEYIYICQNKINNIHIYKINIEFTNYDKVEIQLCNNIITIENDIYHCNKDNKKNILMNIISNEFRKRKYN